MKNNLTKAPTDTFSHPGIQTGKTGKYIQRSIGSVKRKDANLEAEGGETLITSYNGDGIPEKYNIKGKRHKDGGVPLNVPDGSFFYSDTNEMKIKDEETKKLFNVSKKGGVTPAKISKKYDINKYREILADPNSTKMERHTAELMIKNCNEMLAKLALVQESMKGFPDGVPEIAKHYMQKAKLKEEEFNPSMYEMAGIQVIGEENNTPQEDFEESQEEGEPMAKKGKEFHNKKRFQVFLPKQDNNMKYGRVQVFLPESLEKAEKGKEKQSGIGDMKKSYNMFYNKLKDKNFRTEFVRRMREELEKSNVSSKTKYSQSIKDEASKMSDDELVDNFLNNLYRNMAMGHGKADMTNFDDGTGRANKWAKENGYDEFSNAMTAAFQAGYKGLYGMSKDDKYKNYFYNMQLVQTGPKGDGNTLDDESMISIVDGSAGDNTSRQVIALKGNGTSDGIDEKKDADGIDAKHLKEREAEDETGYLTPDKWRMENSLMDYVGRKKYNPWEPGLQFENYNPNFVSPLGTISNQRAMSNGAIRANHLFSGPQQAAAINQQVNGSLADSIVNIDENAAAQNTGTENEAKAKRAELKNTFGEKNANLIRGRYDNQIMANEQADNEKIGRRWNMVDTGTTAWENRSKIRGINTNNDNVWYDPRTGSYRVRPGSIKPETPAPGFYDIYQKYLKNGEDEDVAWSLAEKELGQYNEKIKRQDKKIKDRQTGLVGIGSDSVGTDSYIG